MTSAEAIPSALPAGPDAVLAARLCHDCAAAVPVNGVSLAVVTDDGHQGVLAASDRAARLVEDVQFTLGLGPCVDASRLGIPILLPDLAQSVARRWPGFGPPALEAGVGALFAFPVRADGTSLGVLSLYRNLSGPLQDDELAAALAYAESAVAVLKPPG